MWQQILAGLVGTGLSIGGGLMNQAGQRKVSAQNRQFAADMSLLDYQRQIETWNRQNAYNTPAKQKQRMIEAGLNPALMYGQGTTGNANQMASTDMARSDAEFLPVDFSQISNIAQQLANLKKTSAEIKNLESTNQILNQDAITKYLSNKLLKKQIPYQMHYTPSMIRETYNDLVNSRKLKGRQYLQADANYEWNNLKTFIYRTEGVNIEKDNVTHRLMIKIAHQLAKQLGINVKNLLK